MRTRQAASSVARRTAIEMVPTKAPRRHSCPAVTAVRMTPTAYRVIVRRRHVVKANEAASSVARHRSVPMENARRRGCVAVASRKARAVTSKARRRATRLAIVKGRRQVCGVGVAAISKVRAATSAVHRWKAKGMTSKVLLRVCVAVAVTSRGRVAISRRRLRSSNKTPSPGGPARHRPRRPAGYFFQGMQR